MSKSSKGKRIISNIFGNKKSDGTVLSLLLNLAEAAAVLFKTGDEEDFSLRSLRKMDYYSLQELREKVRTNFDMEGREYILSSIDLVLREKKHPIMEYAETLTNEELNKQVEEARDKFYRTDNHDDWDRFYQLNNEKQARYAKEHPEKFPRHREHGYNLYKED